MYASCPWFTAWQPVFAPLLRRESDRHLPFPRRLERMARSFESRVKPGRQRTWGALAPITCRHPHAFILPSLRYVCSPIPAHIRAFVLSQAPHKRIHCRRLCSDGEVKQRRL